MPDTRSDWDLIESFLKAHGVNASWYPFQRLRSQMEQQGKELTIERVKNHKSAYIALNERYVELEDRYEKAAAKVEQQEGEIARLKEIVSGVDLDAVVKRLNLASVGTQGEQPEITEFPNCFNGCELPAGHTGPHIGGDMIWQNGSDVPPTNIPQPDPRDLRIARLESFVERYRRYHDGVAQCESAEKQSECLCSICYEVRAALSAEGKK